MCSITPGRNYISEAIKADDITPQFPLFSDRKSVFGWLWVGRRRRRASDRRNLVSIHPFCSPRLLGRHETLFKSDKQPPPCTNFASEIKTLKGNVGGRGAENANVVIFISSFVRSLIFDAKPRPFRNQRKCQDDFCRPCDLEFVRRRRDRNLRTFRAAESIDQEVIISSRSRTRCERINQTRVRCELRMSLV